MTIKRALSFIFFLALIPAIGAADEKKWSIEAGVRYSLLSPSGEMGAKKDDEAKQTNLKDLGIDSAEGAIGISIGSQYRRLQFFLSGQQSSFSGTGTTLEEISQGPITIPSGVPVSTTMDLGIYSFIAAYNLIPGDYRLGLGLGVMGLDLEITYTALSDNAQIKIDETYPLPLLALSGSANWKRLEFAALIGGAYINYEGDKVGYLNADIAARYAFYKGNRVSGMVSLGYRYIGMVLDIEADNAMFNLDMDFTGPYVGLRIKY
jgi:hypothetical protein